MAAQLGPLLPVQEHGEVVRLDKEAPNSNQISVKDLHDGFSETPIQPYILTTYLDSDTTQTAKAPHLSSQHNVKAGSCTMNMRISQIRETGLE